MLPNRMYPSSKPMHNSDLASIVNQKQSNVLIQQNSSFETISTSSNGNTHKSQSKLKVLESKQLGDLVLQFREKQCGNKLKLRHKRYATAIAQNFQKSPKQEILKQKTQQNTFPVLQKTLKQINFKKKISQALKSIKLQQQQKNTNTYYNNHNSTVRKNPTSNPTIQSKITVFPSSLNSSKSHATQSPSNDKIQIQQVSLQNSSNRKMDKNQDKYHQANIINNGESLLVKYQQIGKIKQVYSMDEIDDNHTIKFGQQNKQKRRNKKSNNIRFKYQFQQQQKIFKQTTDSNTKTVQKQKEDINTNTKDTITYLQLPPNTHTNTQTNTIAKKQNIPNPTIQKYSIHITQQKNKQNKLPSSHNQQHQHKQPQQTCTRTQTQQQNSNKKQQKLQQQLSTRIGLPTKLYQHVKTNSLPIKLQDINNQLDLGLKIIDDSFQISAIDEQAGSHQLWVVTSMDNKNKNNKNSFVGSARIDRVLGMKQVQDIILDQSIVSPQCQQLKQKLNSLLQQRKQKQHNYISQLNSMDGDVDDILMHLPMLQINSFHKQSVNNCSQMYGQRIIKQEILSCQYNSVQKMGMQSRNKFVIVRDCKNRGQHLFVNQVQYSITKDCKSNNIQIIKAQLKYLLNLQHHSNIISLYDYTIKQQHDKIVVQTLKQPTLYPMYKHSSSTTPYLYKIYNILDIEKQKCTIYEQNAKNIIRQLLSTIIFLNQSQITNNIETYKNKIQNNGQVNIHNKIKMSLKNTYLMQIQSTQAQNKQYILKLDISNNQNINIAYNVSQYQTDINNIQTVINIIHNITTITAINQKLFNNFIQVLQSQRQNIIAKSIQNKKNNQKQKQIGDKNTPVHFWRNLSMHPYIYKYIQCSKEFMEFSHVMF